MDIPAGIFNKIKTFAAEEAKELKAAAVSAEQAADKYQLCKTLAEGFVA